jgi:hypothetical protein
MNGVRWLSWPALLLPLMVGLSLMAGPAVGAEEPSAQEKTLEEQMPEGEALAEQSLDEAPMDIEALNALNLMANTLAQARGFSVTIVPGAKVRALKRSLNGA